MYFKQVFVFLSAKIVFLKYHQHVPFIGDKQTSKIIPKVRFFKNNLAIKNGFSGIDIVKDRLHLVIVLGRKNIILDLSSDLANFTVGLSNMSSNTLMVSELTRLQS